MKPVVFIGPSLGGHKLSFDDLDLRPPAAVGDLALAAHGGVRTIGLVDGLFGTTAAVWHKEILFALSRGCRVLGSSSMGALRAAECQAFGMEPVGAIADMYCRGSIEDDAAVALTHCSVEMDFMPLTVPLVDVWATLAHLRNMDLVSGQEASLVERSAAALHFAERSIDAMFAQCHLAAADMRDAVQAAFEAQFISQKKLDALALISRIRTAQAGDQGRAWIFQESAAWRRLSRQLGIT